MLKFCFFTQVPKGTDKTWVEKLYDKENFDLGSCLQKGGKFGEEDVRGRERKVRGRMRRGGVKGRLQGRRR